jgi:hypothetical protein
MTRPKSFRDVVPDADRKGVWWARDARGNTLGSVYKISWRDPRNVLGWMSSPLREGKDWCSFRTRAGAVAWLYAPEYRPHGLTRVERSRALKDVHVGPYYVGRDRKILIPGHSLVTVNGVERGVIQPMDDDPGMWWLNPGITRCNWTWPMNDGVLRFTTFEDAVRFASQLCDTPGCRCCDRESFDG